MHWRQQYARGNHMLSRDDRVWIGVVAMIVITMIVFSGAVLLWSALH